MNMRTLTIVFASFLVAALGPTAARAATTTHLVESGTGAHIHVSFFSDDGCIGIAMTLDPATSITRQDGTTSSGLTISLFRDDFCNGIFEFAFTTVPLTNEFQTSPGHHSASLNVTVPVETFDFDGVVRTRVVSANVQLQGGNDNTTGISKSRFNFGGLRIVSSGRSVSTLADVTGQISLDGQPLLPDAAASIETSMSVTVDITK